jgi:hypothetical protein
MTVSWKIFKYRKMLIGHFHCFLYPKFNKTRRKFPENNHLFQYLTTWKKKQFSNKNASVRSEHCRIPG